ncbi:sigma-70 family RNA polymerase sigma factor [Auraticoccus monumenti]|uniref:RNA polymerase primary sigma factor n=1 Tax=Auraticoccus monumenti TaxID=675864 RepID=A0A1G7EBD3_9ACTN|nr:sigma-70 family RNA polymerase sigma factor [Auraticoccus monumenti]SDE60937.1 RNA polymerase primary sigma factor [Auraticoccus monumenti]
MTTTLTRTGEPLLSAEDEIGLARAIEAGVLASQALRSQTMPDGEPVPWALAADLEQLQEEGERARQRFVLANVRLVAVEVRRAAARTSVPGDDLFQEGVLALAESLARWDHTRGVRFAGYALPWVRNRIRAAAASRLGELESSVRVGQVRELRLEQLRLVQQLRREPTVPELAARVGRSAGWVAGALQASRPVPLHDATGQVVEIADPRAQAPLELVLEEHWPAAEALGRLPEPVRTVLRHRFGFDGEPESRSALARRLGRSAPQVRRLEELGLEMLREVCPSQCRRTA